MKSSSTVAPGYYCIVNMLIWNSEYACSRFDYEMNDSGVQRRDWRIFSAFASMVNWRDVRVPSIAVDVACRWSDDAKVQFLGGMVISGTATGCLASKLPTRGCRFH